jgi:hypothetical protein
MRPVVFYTLVIILYLASSYFVYEYINYSSVSEDSARIESGIVNAGPSGQGGDVDTMQQQEENIRLEGYGYLGGAVLFILGPTFLLLFRHRLIT